MSQKQTYFSVVGILLAFLTLATGLLTALAVEDMPDSIQSEQSIGVVAAGNCRFGVTPLGSDQYALVGELGAGWILNFFPSSSIPSTGNDARYVPVIRIREARTNGVFNGTWYLNFDEAVTGVAAEAYVKDRVAALPVGRLWLIGNEIERLGQDNITPATYASAYHDIYQWIKEIDPTAQVAISGLVQVTPLRLVYLDMIWDAYMDQFNGAMPVDVWNMHLYAIDEVMSDGFTPSAAGLPVGVNLGQTTAVPKRSSGGQAALCADTNVQCVAEHDDMTSFAEQVVMMRQWMKSKGEQQKPLIITEFSILWPYVDTDGDSNPDFLRDEYGQLFTPQRVSTFLTNSFNYLVNTKDPNLGYGLDDNRLVQQSMWFAIHHPWFDIDNDGILDYGNYLAASPGSASDLYFPVNPPTDMTLAITPVGQAFKNYVNNMSSTPNLLIETLPPVVIAPVAAPTTVTATLQVKIRNVGNTAVSAPFTISFYDENDSLIGSTTVNESIDGCGLYPYTFAVDWGINISNSASSVLPFKVKIDSGLGIGESNDSDNEATSFVIINAQQLYLPIITK